MAILTRVGAAIVCCEEPDDGREDWHEWVRRVLVHRAGLRHLVHGHDQTLGHLVPRVVMYCRGQ